MKTIVEALKDLYVALGGSSSDVSGLSLNPDVIEKMATLVTSGALKELPSLTGNAGKVLKVASGASGVEWADEKKELPAVSAEDNGDVLTVVEGAWAKAAPSGGDIITDMTEYTTIDSHTSADVYIFTGGAWTAIPNVRVAGCFSGAVDGYRVFSVPSGDGRILYNPMYMESISYEAHDEIGIDAGFYITSSGRGSLYGLANSSTIGFFTDATGIYNDGEN